MFFAIHSINSSFAQLHILDSLRTELQIKLINPEKRIALLVKQSKEYPESSPDTSLI